MKRPEGGGKPRWRRGGGKLQSAPTMNLRRGGEEILGEGRENSEVLLKEENVNSQLEIGIKEKKESLVEEKETKKTPTEGDQHILQCRSIGAFLTTFSINESKNPEKKGGWKYREKNHLPFSSGKKFLRGGKRANVLTGRDIGS